MNETGVEMPAITQVGPSSAQNVGERANSASHERIRDAEARFEPHFPESLAGAMERGT